VFDDSRCHIVPWKNEEHVFSHYFESKVPLGMIERTYAEEKVVDDLQMYRLTDEKTDRTFSDQFIKLFISEGCNLNCSYCSEKRTFPEYASYDEETLITACREIINEKKQYDIMLIGDNVGEYGKDRGSSLPQLMRRLFFLHPDVKIGIQNLNPAYFIEYFDDFVEFILQKRMLHLRLPIQSASDEILRTPLSFFEQHLVLI